MLTLFATGRKTGVVLNSGGDTTYITPIVEFEQVGFKTRCKLLAQCFRPVLSHCC